MLKEEFLGKLRSELSGFPKQELEERLGFYSEMIDDRMEEGCTEEEAVSEIGSAEDISAQIISDIPLSKIAKERIKPKKDIPTPVTVLLILGSPIWFSLAIAAFCIIFSLYIVLWSVTVSVWSVFASFAACAVGGVVAGAVLTFSGKVLTGIAIISAGLVFAGLSVFLFMGCKAATKGIIYLTKKIAIGIKRCFIKKENAQ